MTRQYRWALVCAIAAVLFVAGCETTGGNQMQTTVYDTHRRMVKLDRELEDSVGRLNETTATLLARVDASDEQTRMLRGLLEENQQKLEMLGRELHDMRTTLYRHWGLTTTTPGAPRVSDVVPGQVTVESPTAPQQQTPQHELRDSAPLPTDELSPSVAPLEEIDDARVMEETPAAPPTTSGAEPVEVYRQAQQNYAQENYETALGQFDNYLQRFPSHDPNLSANAQFWKAKCLMNMERYAEAVQAFETLRGAYPNSSKVPFALHNQAVTHSRLGQTAQAERLMEAVVEQFPVSPAADQARADLRTLHGE